MDQRDRISQGTPVSYGASTELRHHHPAWSAPPLSDFPSSGTQSDVTPASHHALNTAYGNLKKRYNDLQTKYYQREKQWKELQRRESSPHMFGGSGSSRPRSEGLLSTHGFVTDTDGTVNGEVSLGDAVSLATKERKLLERQIRDVEHQMRDLREQLADSEHEKQQLREHVSRQEDELRQNQQHLMLTEKENEELKKQIVLIRRRLRSPDLERKAGQVGASSGAGSLDLPRLGGALDTPSLGEELQVMVRSSIHAQQDVTELLSVVRKQRDVIKMLVSRLHTSQVAAVAAAVPSRQWDAQGAVIPQFGVGARPKVRSSSRDSFRDVTNPTRNHGMDTGHLVRSIECSEDPNTLVLDKDRTDGPRSSGSFNRGQGDRPAPNSHGILRSPERAEVSSHRLRMPSDRYSAPAGSSVWQQCGRVGIDSDSDPEHHYDDIEFGALGVAWQPKVVQDQPVELEPLVCANRGLSRNDSLEHLHEDSAAVNMTDDEDIYGNGGALSESTPTTSDEPSVQDLSTTTTRVLTPENRYRNTTSTGHQRALNIERNEYENRGGAQRSYDNTTQNINLNRSGSDKFPSNLDNPQERYPILNNNPLAGHKTIPHRNIYREPPGDADGDSVAPPGGNARVAVEHANVELADETRNCPVCTEDFPSQLPMEEFQQHVLECTGLPERICPMCENVFPEEVLQAEFERHVNGHFDDDSLITRFEVIRE